MTGLDSCFSRNMVIRNCLGFPGLDNLNIVDRAVVVSSMLVAKSFASSQHVVI